jgi:hypothetical protein
MFRGGFANALSAQTFNNDADAMAFINDRLVELFVVKTIGDYAFRVLCKLQGDAFDVAQSRCV